MNIAAMIKLTISMAIFGSIGFFTIHTGIPAVELVFIRCICATLFLGGLWLITGGHKTEQWDKKELETICKDKGLILGAILEEVNDYSYSKVDDAVVEEDGDCIYVTLDYKNELL